MNGIDEPCRYVVRFDEARCRENAPCDELAAFFADPSGCGRMGRVLRTFTEAGYVTTCIELFESEEAAYRVPHVEEADRIDHALSAVVASEEVRAHWSGKNLLIAGVGEGATAVMVAMARTDIDTGAHFRGNINTAACFLEGSYDVAALDRFIGESGHGGGACRYPVSHAQVVGRYYEHAPETHSCEQHSCPCATDHAPTVDIDTITEVPPEAYALRHFAMIECGSELDPCRDDVVPAVPMRALCSVLDADPTTSCTFESMAHTSHASCASVGASHCVAWAATVFDG